MRRQDFVPRPEQEHLKHTYLERIEALKAHGNASISLPMKMPECEECDDNDEWELVETEEDIISERNPGPMPEQSSESKVKPTRRRIVPDAAGHRLHVAWKDLLPSLVEPFLQYSNISSGNATVPAENVRAKCIKSGCGEKSTRITCLYWDRGSISSL